MNIKKLFLILFVLAIALTSIVGCSSTEQPAEQVEELDLIPVRVSEVSLGEIAKTFVYVSKLKPEERIDILPTVTGKVEAVYFDVGDIVKKDDVLFKIDEESVRDNINDLEKQLETLNLTIDLQKLSLQSSKNGQYKQQLLQLQQLVDSSKLSYDSAIKAYEDTKKLFEKGSASQQQYDQTKTAYQQAELAYQTAKANYDLYVNDLSKTNIQSAENQLQQSYVRKEQLALSLKNLNEMLEDTSVKSPISGLVSGRSIEINQLASPQMAAFTVINTDSMFIDVGVSENVVSKISVQDKVDVMINSVSDNPFEGEIYAISPAADDRTSSYLTKIQLKNTEQQLKSGMFAEVSFKVDSTNNVLTVPINVVLSDSDGQFVYIAEMDTQGEDTKATADEGNTSQEDSTKVAIARKAMVKTGLDDGRLIEITEGLSVGDIIIIDGQNYIENDDRVKIVE